MQQASLLPEQAISPPQAGPIPTRSRPDPKSDGPRSHGQSTTISERVHGTSSEARALCRHCGLTLPADASSEFCCLGCEFARSVVERAGLGRYYELGGRAGQPVARSSRRDHKWVEPLQSAIAQCDGVLHVELDVQGIHCAACVWLIERWFAQRAGGVSIVVNPALGKARLAVDRTFQLDSFVSELDGLGYVLGPSRKAASRASSDLVLRMGVCIAIAMNTMLFAIAIYAGLEEGSVRLLFDRLSLGLSACSVAIGGPVFFRAAWKGLRGGLLHLDLPISMGILLAFGSSVVSYCLDARPALYLDTLSTFIALMLVGRFLQERVIAKNRQQLLASEDADTLLVRRLHGGVVETVPAGQLRPGDWLLVAPGDVVVTRGRLCGPQGTACSLDWISGESEPRRFEIGSTLPAGAIVEGNTTIEVEALESFADSSLVELLRIPGSLADRRDARSPFWDRLARVYVAGVLVVAACAFVWAELRGDELRTAIREMTAVLIVTCPCAFGIATPLAHEIVLARLRKAGLFVRSLGFLDRARFVRQIVFDKTGTLTTGTLTIANTPALDGLTAAEATLLYNLAARSTHPKSLAVTHALGARRAHDAPHASEGPRSGLHYDASLLVHHAPGLGVSLTTAEGTYRLGAPGWAGPLRARATAQHDDLVFAVDGRVLCTLSTAETLRADARAEVQQLAQDGYCVWIVSGDASARVRAMATHCGVPLERALSEQSPAGKREFIQRVDRSDTLMVGDGINDSLAIADAWCSATPAVDRPFLAAKSDFYFTTPGLRPIRLALRASRILAQVVRMNLSMALAYNLVAVALASTGRLSPLLCAIIMPLSSIATLTATTFSLSERRVRWRS